MEETLALINKIIDEHKQIHQRVRTLDGITNDLSAMSELETAKEGFMPRRLDNQRRGLQIWQEAIQAVDEGLQAHFNREEKGLLTAFEEHGDRMLASALHVLLLEHEEIRNRLAKLKTEAVELAVGGLSREVWEGKAWGLRIYIGLTRKLIESHARSEEKLLRTLRSELKKATKGND